MNIEFFIEYKMVFFWIWLIGTIIFISLHSLEEIFSIDLPFLFLFSSFWFVWMFIWLHDQCAYRNKMRPKEERCPKCRKRISDIDCCNWRNK